MKNGSALVHSIVYDVCNWGGKIAFISFVYAMNHTYGYVLFGFALGKFASAAILDYNRFKLEQKMKKELQTLQQNIYDKIGTARTADEEDVILEEGEEKPAKTEGKLH